MLFLADGESEVVKNLEVFEPEVEVEPSAAETDLGEGANGKGKPSY